jgi:hypothetical protein
MPQVLHVLNADRSLDQWVERIERAFSRSTRLIESYIPLGNIDVVVYNDPDYVVPELVS